MKHISLSGAWYYSKKPSPAFRCRLNHQGPTAILEVKGIPLDVKKQFTLPENCFCVSRYRYHNAYFVQAGQDKSNGCLLFVGHTGKRHSHVYLDETGTTGIVLADYLVSQNNIPRLEIIVMLEIDQCVSFHTSGTISNEVWRYQWNGVKVVRSVHTNINAEQCRVNTMGGLCN